MSLPPRILVFGSAGFIGLNLVDALVAAGHDPLCAHRGRTNTLPLRRRGVRRVVADCGSPDLVHALRGTDVVFHCAGHYPRDARTPELTLLRAVDDLDHVLTSAAEAGVRRLVYVSSTATVAPRADGYPSNERDVFATRPHIGAYHDAKWAMEARAAAEERLEVVVACPSACLGPWDLRVGTASLIVATARGDNPRHPDGIVSLVDVRDVAKVLVTLGTMPEPPPRVLISALNTTLQRLLGDVARYFGVAAPGAALSLAAALAFADSEEARVAGTPERALLAREIVDLVAHGTAIDARLAQSLLPGGFTRFNATLDEVACFYRKLGIIPSRPESTLGTQHD